MSKFNTQVGPLIRPPDQMAESLEIMAKVLGASVEPEILQLGVEDEAASPDLMAKCPVCMCANPCARHSYAQQIRALNDPEYLDQLAKWLKRSAASSVDMGRGCEP